MGVLVGQTCGLTEYVGQIVLHQDRRVDPDRTYVRCAAHRLNGCERVVLMAKSVSYAACLATTGESGLGAFIIQCGEEQHFCCSAECALVAHVYCMANHVYPVVAAVLRARESGVLRAADVATARLVPATADDADAARTIKQLATRGEARARAKRGTGRKRLASPAC